MVNGLKLNFNEKLISNNMVIKWNQDNLTATPVKLLRADNVLNGWPVAFKPN